MTDDIGEWYRKQDEKAKQLREQIKNEKSKETPNLKLIKSLQHQLELAEYVGD